MGEKRIPKPAIEARAAQMQPLTKFTEALESRLQVSAALARKLGLCFAVTQREVPRYPGTQVHSVIYTKYEFMVYFAH